MLFILLKVNKLCHSVDKVKESEHPTYQFVSYSFKLLLAPDSRGITIFITKTGLYRYTRLMFGINCAPEIFQKTLEQILSGCNNCMNFIDDIIVFGRTKEIHDENLKRVLQRLKERNVALNKEKCVFGTKTLIFLGHRLSASGISPSQEKLKAIRDARTPESSEEIRSFLGLVNYVGRFIPNLATLTDVLRKLTKKNEIFCWKEEHQNAFVNLKNALSSDMVLAFYKNERRTRVVADASPVGLGAVLIQFNESNDPKVISYASKSLSDIERRYCQTEKRRWR